MKILLDENFPLPLYHRLRAAGYDVEHIIILGQRGLPDAAIRARLAVEPLLLLTHDTEFEGIPADYPAIVAISRVPQSLPTKQRVEIWFAAIESFVPEKDVGNVFDLLETGAIVVRGGSESH